MIRYPDDQATEAEADRHGIPNFVLALEEDPVFGADEWGKLVYLRSRRDRFNQATLKKAVQVLLVPMLR